MKRLLAGIAFLAFVVAIFLYASGAFRKNQIEPGKLPEPAGRPVPRQTVQVTRAEVPVVEEAVGTVDSRTRVAISAQIPARVMEVRAEAGATVSEGQTIILLDDREQRARVGQAEDAHRQAEAARNRAVQARAGAQAVLAQAKKHYDRIKSLFDGEAATLEQLEQAEAALLQAQAGLAETEAAIAAAQAQIEQAAQVVAEAKVALGHATIRAPIRGVVSMKAVEPGDLALPGRTLLELLDPKALRLDAQVREGLIRLVVKGGTFDVEIPSARLTLQGTIDEVCPTADPLSRTFKVRVDIEGVRGVHPGMYGRLHIPVGKREVVRVPREAVIRVGQLETVTVKEGDRWVRRYVTTGKDLGDGMVEILSGLAGGETVALAEVG
ncbi:MAG: efflux RND transporter periplasmic adaptor subunit [Planctomycetota bacterium]